MDGSSTVRALVKSGYTVTTLVGLDAIRAWGKFQMPNQLLFEYWFLTSYHLVSVSILCHTMINQEAWEQVYSDHSNIENEVMQSHKHTKLKITKELQDQLATLHLPRPGW